MYEEILDDKEHVWFVSLSNLNCLKALPPQNFLWQQSNICSVGCEGVNLSFIFTFRLSEPVYCANLETPQSLACLFLNPTRHPMKPAPISPAMSSPSLSSGEVLPPWTNGIWQKEKNLPGCITSKHRGPC